LNITDWYRWFVLIADEAVRGLLVLYHWRKRKVLRREEAQLSAQPTSQLEKQNDSLGLNDKHFVNTDLSFIR
jgi:hypothetical protein